MKKRLYGNDLPPAAGTWRRSVISIHGVAGLCGRPRIQERGGVHQIVGDDPESDPPSHAVGAMVATASESMSAFNHADAPFAPDAPALTAVAATAVTGAAGIRNQIARALNSLAFAPPQ